MPAFCSQCGIALAADARFCEECGTQVIAMATTTTTHPERYSPQAPTQKPSSAAVTEVQRSIVVVAETKSGGIAIVLSFLWTGLGQLYAGRIARGLVMMMVTPGVWAIGWFGGFAAFIGGAGSFVAKTAQESATAAGLGFFGFVTAVLPFIWWLWGMIDAKNSCEAFNRRVERSW